MWQQTLAGVAIAWYALILLVITIGTVQLYRHFHQTPVAPIAPSLPLHHVPHITIIRPVTGHDAQLETCLASIFTQHYPRPKLSIALCVPSRKDPAFAVVERVHKRFPRYDCQVYIEEDAGLQDHLGPNPKIRNISAAYRAARGDIIWILDCNVWISPDTAGYMVDRLCGFGHQRKAKFVHQLPLIVDVADRSPHSSLRTAAPPGLEKRASSNPRPTGASLPRSSYLISPGSLLEEMFLSTAHAKFYTAISTVAVAPCIIGKSNMFRRSHLKGLTQPSAGSRRAAGVDFFSDNICEDHLIGDLLWKAPVPTKVRADAAAEGGVIDSRKDGDCMGQPGEVRRDAGNSCKSPAFRRWQNHALVLVPPCVQPMADVSVSAYAARRARWLRVRKFTVPVATLVEPCTESLVATTLGAWGLTSFPFSNHVDHLGVIGRLLSSLYGSWKAFGCLWVLGMLGWLMLDRWLWIMLQSWQGDARRVAVSGLASTSAHQEDSSSLQTGSNGGRERSSQDNSTTLTSRTTSLSHNTTNTKQRTAPARSEAERLSSSASRASSGITPENASEAVPETAAETAPAEAPNFIGSASRRLGRDWLIAWCARELLAFPIWAWAVLGGTEVVWRGRRFWVGLDMRVHAIDCAT